VIFWSWIFAILQKKNSRKNIMSQILCFLHPKKIKIKIKIRQKSP
jgi:hypothetical protein